MESIINIIEQYKSGKISYSEGEKLVVELVRRTMMDVLRSSSIEKLTKEDHINYVLIFDFMLLRNHMFFEFLVTRYTSAKRGKN